MSAASASDHDRCLICSLPCADEQLLCSWSCVLRANREIDANVAVYRRLRRMGSDDGECYAIVLRNGHLISAINRYYEEPTTSLGPSSRRGSPGGP